MLQARVDDGDDLDLDFDYYLFISVPVTTQVPRPPHDRAWHKRLDTHTHAGDGAKATTRPCLAQEVLAELPDTQQWLRQAIMSIAKGGTNWEDGCPTFVPAALQACV